MLQNIEKNTSEQVTNEDQHDGQDLAEGNDLLSKLGLSKKDKLKKENAELKHKAEELNDKFLRLYAEFDNYKKRTQKERIEVAKTAGIEIINALIPVIDDFSRAMKQMETSNDLSGLQEGVKLIQQKMNAVLESRGLKQMKSLGETFNPELHEAIAEIPAPDQQLSGKVVDEIESGYYLHDKIIRHAKVVVGK
ncbi:MAG: nucleotide exchange factor GrpE [Chitinophagaceae bacterium]|nr:nucleotide exchange factor GrpE [Chitinophagaceae bacterium]